MSKIVGIDLGTTNSLVAIVDSGIPLVLADADGQRLTPSVVHFPSAADEPIVGHKANRIRLLKPTETIYSIKRFMGRRADEVSEEEKGVPYPLGGGSSGSLQVIVHGKAYSPEEISAAILRK